MNGTPGSRGMEWKQAVLRRYRGRQDGHLRCFRHFETRRSGKNLRRLRVSHGLVAQQYENCVLAGRPASRRKHRERGVADRAQTATNPDPVVALIVSLLAPPPMTDDRVAQTTRAQPRKMLGTDSGPIQSGVVIVRAKWDKKNRIRRELDRRQQSGRLDVCEEPSPPQGKISTISTEKKEKE